MPRISAILPKVNIYPHARASRCSYCGCGILYKYGGVQKRIKDLYVPEDAAMRYRCVRYERAFTHYPQGVDRSGCSVRLRAVMSLMWVLGLSAQVCGMRADGAGMPGV